MAKSADETSGTMSANIGAKSYELVLPSDSALRFACVTKGVCTKTSPANAMVRVVSLSGFVVLLVAAVPQAETSKMHANSAVRFTLLI
jgi:hypothetical protein